jgi:hypothetical protein
VRGSGVPTPESRVENGVDEALSAHFRVVLPHARTAASLGDALSSQSWRPCGHPVASASGTRRRRTSFAISRTGSGGGRARRSSLLVRRGVRSRALRRMGALLGEQEGSVGDDRLDACLRVDASVSPTSCRCPHRTTSGRDGRRRPRFRNCLRATADPSGWQRMSLVVHSSRRPINGSRVAITGASSARSASRHAYSRPGIRSSDEARPVAGATGCGMHRQGALRSAAAARGVSIGSVGRYRRWSRRRVR